MVSGDAISASQLETDNGFAYGIATGGYQRHRADEYEGLVGLYKGSDTQKGEIRIVAKRSATHVVRMRDAHTTVTACIDTEEHPRISFKVGLCVDSSDSDDERTGRIQIHHPDRAEIEEAKLAFTQILEKMGENAPLVVTLCRSMRDGYAPRAYWQEIDRD